LLKIVFQDVNEAVFQPVGEVVDKVDGEAVAVVLLQDDDIGLQMIEDPATRNVLRIKCKLFKEDPLRLRQGLFYL